MPTTNINRIVLTGNLTRDPELRSTPDGTAVCRLRIASSSRRRHATTGEWTDKPNYFDVTVFGAPGENAARYLTAGRGVAIDGRLDWHEWHSRDGSTRQAIQIIADTVQFLGTPQHAPNHQPHNRPPGTTVSSDDDIPF
jgi:single-strand DNA-binding protein